MSLLQGVLLGLIQGLTEFLPVSSSGHLVIAQELVGFKEPPMAVDAILHLGTVVAVIVYFRHELNVILQSIWKWARWREHDQHSRIAGYLAIATVPAVVMGLAFEDVFNHGFGSVLLVGAMLVITGLILWSAESVVAGTRVLDQLTLSDSLLVGFAQALAIMPGISRSGATIVMGMWRGFDRAEAARFSFLLAIPVIIGASGLTSLRGEIDRDILPVVTVATLAAGVSGYTAIAVLMRVIELHRLRFLAVYCFIVGGLSMAWSLMS